jgi:proton-coupled amino acid transporter
MGPAGKTAVNVSVILSQAGFCCVYVAFIARNVLQTLNFSRCWIGAQWLWVLVLLQVPIFVPLSWVRKLIYFGYTSLLADGLIVAGLTGILAYCIHGFATQEPGPPLAATATAAAPEASVAATNGFSLPLFNSSAFPLFLGSAIYAFEGIGMITPIYDSLSRAGKRTFPRVLTVTLLGIAAAYVVVGMVPYAYLHGFAHVPMQDAVTLNLPQKVWWAAAVRICYCLALVFSFPLMLFPALRILEDTLLPILCHRRRSSRGRGTPSASGPATAADPPYVHATWTVNGFRSVVVCCCLLISYLAISQLDNLVALIGCFCCCPLCFIYPNLFHLRIRTRQLQLRGTTATENARSLLGSDCASPSDPFNGAPALYPWYRRIVDVSVVLFGGGVFVFSTYQAIDSWGHSTVEGCVS